MSLTASRGMMDAGRWTTVATAVAEHLAEVEDAIEAQRALPSAPVGALDAAQQFFNYVLGALDQGSTQGAGGVTPARVSPSPTPTMAGISNLSIAVTVMRSAHGLASPANLQKVREQVDSFSSILSALQEHRSERLEKQELTKLHEFFKELGKAGRIDRAATIATHERPVRAIS
ncbi:MAG: hypothetical protein K1X67_16805 [Fimbriimonadaceae bacterium]|nr:hypothetical protein [Fimbriimonadaceae bacterium]